MVDLHRKGLSSSRDIIAALRNRDRAGKPQRLVFPRFSPPVQGDMNGR
jgi:hypothetical protein